MKKVISIIASVALFVATVLAVLSVFRDVYRAGIRHALYDSEIWFLDEEMRFDQYELHVLIDDEWYHPTMYIG